MDFDSRPISDSMKVHPIIDDRSRYNFCANFDFDFMPDFVTDFPQFGLTNSPETGF